MSRCAIKNALPIKNSYAEKIYYIIYIKLYLENNINCCPLGSTGKKKDNEESGDIDIAVLLDFNTENINKIKQIITDNFNYSEITILAGFKIISARISQDLSK